MYTVVIAEQKHLDSIREYNLFLQPFLEHSAAVFCAWDPDREHLSDSVPELRKAIHRGEKWRAIIVTDDGGREQKNPFDRVQHRDPDWNPDLTEEENRARRLEARIASYEKAAGYPLSRLVAHLCDYPSLSREGLMSNDPDFRDYQTLDAKRKELQQEIIGTEPQDFLKPAEIICVARRSCTDERYDIRTSWSPHLDLEYSRFTDFNLYYPRMRYLVFDVLPTAHRNYRFDNVKFLYALLLLACNDLPGDALQANRVYSICCENDTRILSELLQNYDDRLQATQKMLEEEIAILMRADPEKLSDKELEAFFLTRTNIALRPDSGFEESELYVQSGRFGLFSDRPQEEKQLWREEYGRSQKGLTAFLKQPKKSIRAAVSDVHIQSQNVESFEKAHLLNEQQIGEFREYLRDEEAAAVESRPINLADPAEFRKAAAEAAAEVERHLETRMKRRTGLIAIGVALFAFLIGLLPVFFAGELTTPVIAAIVASLALLLAAAVICLFFQRGRLRAKLRDYNDEMHAISDSVHANMERYATYLGHVCSLLKGNVVDNALREDSDDVRNRCKIYRKHIVDIRNLREEFALTFSQFLRPGQERAIDAQPFAFDFRSTVTYCYPLISGELQSRRVEFLQKGNYVELPVNYIRCVELRREELYD